MTIFTKLYSWIKSFKTPGWLRDMLKEIQDLIVATFLSIGKEYLQDLSDKIIEVQGMGISGEEKFKLVYQYGKSAIPDVKESVLRRTIEILVGIAKKNSFARVIE